jgi:DNA-binding transcriptional LysR family regulator
MAPQPVITLNQLQVLLTIAETGSFTAAAKKLNRATSGITYTIDTLEAQLGLTLFHRGTTRRTALTREGEAIVAEARLVASGTDRFRARVKGLLEGLEAEVALAVDEMFPAERLAAILGGFEREFPTVALRLNLEVLGGVERMVRDGMSGIGLGGVCHMDAEGLTTFRIGEVLLIPVAAPGHALAQGGFASPGIAREFLQIIITERYRAKGRAYGVLGEKVWRVSDLASKRVLLLAGIGWGGMPEPTVRGDIEAGRLVYLNLPDWRQGGYEMQVVHRDDTPPGVAGRWLIEQLLGHSP